MLFRSEYENWETDRAVKIFASNNVSFILTESGKVYAFGDNNFGRLSIGSNAASTGVPTTMKDSAGNEIVSAVDLSVGAGYTYVLTQDLVSGDSVVYAAGEEYRTTQAITQVTNVSELSGHYMRTSGGKVWRIIAGSTVATPIIGFTNVQIGRAHV